MVDIATRVYNHTWKIDPIVRVSIASIRERIRDYFESEGRQERIRVVLPKGQYRLQFAPQPEAERPPAAPDTAASRFWAPYHSPANPNLLVYTELLFFRDPEGNYVRNIYVNDRSSGEAEIRERLGLGGKLPQYRQAWECQRGTDSPGAAKRLGGQRSG